MSTKKWLSAAEFLAGSQSSEGDREPSWLYQMIRWIIEEICQPNADLGRQGDVCPFVRPSLKQNLLFIEECDLGAQDEALLVSFMLDRSQVFLKTPPCLPQPNSIYKSLLVAFPAIDSEHGIILQSVRRTIKPTLLSIGLTCGEFYPWSEDKSVRSKDLPIARSPIPCIAIRYLSTHDIIFLRSQQELLEIYKQQYPESM